jgi:hypothetical protein
VILALTLLPYLFQQQNGKRGANRAPKVTKLDSYKRFLPHFTSLTEMEAFEDTQNFIEKPVQVCVVGNLCRPFAVLRIFNSKYSFASPRVAVDAAFMGLMALKLDFPAEAVQPWQFLRKFVYDVEGKKGGSRDGDKIYPQVDTMINELNLVMKMS